ncbi:MAG: hypothetical protein WCJ35_28285, partial [Planctomycetota bacterium]
QDARATVATVCQRILPHTAVDIGQTGCDNRAIAGCFPWTYLLQGVEADPAPPTFPKQHPANP